MNDNYYRNVLTGSGNWAKEFYITQTWVDNKTNLYPQYWVKDKIQFYPEFLKSPNFNEEIQQEIKQEEKNIEDIFEELPRHIEIE